MMRWSLLALQTLVAAASTFNVASFRLQELMAPQSAELDRLAAGALAAIVLLCVGMVVIWRYAGPLRGPSAGVAVAILLLTAASGFAPRMVWAHRQAVAEAEHLAEDRRSNEAFASELREWTDQTNANAATHRPLSAEQASAFVDFASRAGRYDDGKDPPSAQALALLSKALAADILDVNAPVQGSRLNDTAPRPLFLQFYKERIEPLRHVDALAAQDWAVMQLLAAAGADLSQSDATPLVADLAKTSVPGAGRFIGLH